MQNNKKTKSKKILPKNKKNLQERLWEYYGSLSKDGKIMLTIEIKICQMKIKTDKKIYEKLLL